jgi:hypothetical protein
MSQLTSASRVSDGGRTELTIADGFIYIDLFRGDIHVDQRIFNATDLINVDIDRILMAGPQRSRRNNASR